MTFKMNDIRFNFSVGMVCVVFCIFCIPNLCKGDTPTGRPKVHATRVTRPESRRTGTAEQISNVSDSLETYEIISPTISRISFMKNGILYTESVKFAAFGKLFDLLLHEAQRVIQLKDEFEITVGNKKMSRTDVADILDEMKHYDGECFGTESCVVSGVINTRNNTFEGKITLAGEIYHIEKRNIPRSTQNGSDIDLFKSTERLIVFRESDVLPTIISSENVDIIGEEFEPPVQKNNSQGHRRNRRLEPDRDRQGTVCYIFVMVDHRYFKHFSNSMSAVVQHVRQLIYQTDKLFAGADFNKDGMADNIGVGLSGIRIFTEEDSPFQKSKFPKFDDNQLASVFDLMKLYDYSDHCLALTLTTVNDRYGKVGLSYVPTTMPQSGGGICEKGGYGSLRIVDPPRSKYGIYYRNVIAVTNSRFRKPMMQYEVLVTLAHEVGHSFGSPHDPRPRRGTCVEHDGYLMVARGIRLSQYTFVLSECSIQKIYPVVTLRGDCLLKRTEHICGNGVKESSEECDCGDTLRCGMMGDSCCTPSDVGKYENNKNGDKPCTLRRSKGKTCSPLLSPCCDDDCQPANKEKICSYGDKCLDDARCDGNSLECPMTPMPRGTVCNDGQNVCDGLGNCSLHICEQDGLQPCQCTHQESAYCVVCCLSRNNICMTGSELGIFAGYDVMKSPRSSCYNDCGLCDNHGVCRKITNEDKLEADFVKMTDEIEPLTSPASRWFGQYWYYFVIGPMFLFIFIFIMIVTIHRSNSLDTKSYMNGRFHRILGEAEHLKSKEKQNMTRMEEMFESKLRIVKYDRSGKNFSDSLSRLSTFFPTVPTHILAKSVTTCSSEEVAVRFLLVRGYPFKVLQQ